MHAIAFDLRMDLLGYAYGNSCSKACEEIRREMESIGFEWIQGNIYLSRKDSLASVYKAMNRLSQIPWFRDCARSVCAFQMEDWSDFTGIVKAKSDETESTKTLDTPFACLSGLPDSPQDPFVCRYSPHAWR